MRSVRCSQLVAVDVVIRCKEQLTVYNRQFWVDVFHDLRDPPRLAHNSSPWAESNRSKKIIDIGPRSAGSATQGLFGERHRWLGGFPPLM